MQNRVQLNVNEFDLNEKGFSSQVWNNVLFFFVQEKYAIKVS